MNWKITAAALLVLPVAAIAADTVQLKPGRWEVQSATSAASNGRAIPPAFVPNTPPAYRCLSPATAANPTGYFLKATNCGAPEGRAEGGNIRLKTRCTSPNGVKISMDVSGTYTSDSYDVVTRSIGKLKGVTLDTTFHDRARYVGPCQGDETG